MTGTDGTQFLTLQQSDLLLTVITAPSAQKRKEEIMKDQSQNNKSANYTHEERFWMQKCHWLGHWDIPPTISNHCLWESCVAQLGSLTIDLHKPAHKLRYSHHFSMWSANYLDPASNHYLSRITTRSEVDVLRAWAKHFSTTFICSCSVSLLKTEI